MEFDQGAQVTIPGCSERASWIPGVKPYRCIKIDLLGIEVRNVEPSELVDKLHGSVAKSVEGLPTNALGMLLAGLAF